MEQYAGDAELIPDGGGEALGVRVYLRSQKRGLTMYWSGNVYSRKAGQRIDVDLTQYTIRLLPSGNEGTLLVHRVNHDYDSKRGYRQQVHCVGSGPAPF